MEFDKTTTDRVLASLNHEEGDRVPIWTLLDNSAALRHFAPEGFDFSRFTSGDADTAALELTGHACRGLGIDVTFLCDTYVVNPFPRETAEHQTGSYDRHPIQTMADVEAFTPTIESYDEIAGDFVPKWRCAQEIVGPQTILVSQGSTCIEGACGMMGLELLSLAIYDAPESVSRIMEAYTELQRTKAQVYADHKIAPAYQVSCDIAYKGALMYSPEFLRREMVPRLRREFEPLKQAGIKLVLHCDGNLMEILDDLVDAGIDGLNPIEPTAGMDLAAIKKRYGKNLVLNGNVDANIGTVGTPEEVVEEVKRCIRDAGAGGGLCIDSGAGEIFPSFPIENVIAMCEAVHEHGRYPVAL